MIRNLRTFWSRGGGPSRRPAPNVLVLHPNARRVGAWLRAGDMPPGVRLMLCHPFGYARSDNPL